jgi:long-chain acyl-CoA synthetase
VITKASLIGQSFVYGDSLHSMLVGIITPDVDQVKSWAAKNNCADKSPADVVKMSEFNKAVMDEIAEQSAAAKLQSFEKVRAVHIDAVPWTPDDVLTATFKLKRQDAKKKYQAQIDQMYIKLGDLIAGQHVNQK